MPAQLRMLSVQSYPTLTHYKYPRPATTDVKYVVRLHMSEPPFVYSSKPVWDRAEAEELKKQLHSRQQALEAVWPDERAVDIIFEEAENAAAEKVSSQNDEGLAQAGADE